MSYPPCSARGREHIHRHPLHNPRRHCRHFDSSAPRRLVGQHATLSRHKELAITEQLAVAATDALIARAHRIWTLSFGPRVGSDLRADREHSLGFDTAGPEARPYHSINSRKAKGRWYYWSQ